MSCLSKYLSGSRGKSTLGLSSTTSWMLRRCHQTILEQTKGWSQDYRLRGWHWSVWSWASQTRLHSSVCSGHLTWNVEWSKEEKRLPEIHLRSIELWSESWSYERWLLRMSNQLLWWKWFAWSRLVRFWIVLFFWNWQASGIIITMKEKVRIRDLLLFSAFICIKNPS